jgi:hypothetical protein
VTLEQVVAADIVQMVAFDASTAADHSQVDIVDREE